MHWKQYTIAIFIWYSYVNAPWTKTTPFTVVILWRTCIIESTLSAEISTVISTHFDQVRHGCRTSPWTRTKLYAQKYFQFFFIAVPHNFFAYYYYVGLKNYAIYPCFLCVYIQLDLCMYLLCFVRPRSKPVHRSLSLYSSLSFSHYADCSCKVVRENKTKRQRERTAAEEIKSKETITRTHKHV